MMETMILARVSTKEQEEGHSIEAQIQRLKEYCVRKNLNIIKIFKIIESYLAQDDVSENDNELNQEHHFSSESTDPDQERILKCVSKEETLLIQGPPGTGKSMTLTSILTNALHNQFSCLVVCEKQTARDVLENNLRKHGLESLFISIRDVSRDRKEVVERIRNSLDYYLNKTDYGESTRNISLNQYAKDMKECIELQDDINKRYKASHKEIIFDGRNWRQIVALYLKAKKAKEKISKTLDEKNLTKKLKKCFPKIVNEDEFNSVVEALQNAREKFQEEVFQSSLKKLEPSVFEGEYTKSIENKVIEVLDKMNRFLTKAKEDGKKINTKNLNFLKKTNSQMQSLCKVAQNSLKKNYPKSKEHKIKENITLIKDLLLFKFTRITITYINDYKVLKKEHKKIPLFNFNFSVFPKSVFEKKLEEYLKRVEKHQQVLEGNLATELFLCDEFQRDLSSLYETLKDNLKNETSKGFFDPKIDDNQKFKSYLSSYEKEVEDIEKSMRDFKGFFAWYSFWHAIDEKSKKVIELFNDLDLEIDTWGALFKEWYYNKILEENEPKFRFHVDDEKIKVHKEKREGIIRKQPNLIKQKQEKYLNAFLKELDDDDIRKLKPRRK